VVALLTAELLRLLAVAWTSGCSCFLLALGKLAVSFIWLREVNRSNA
jgi:hypothetical protein